MGSTCHFRLLLSPKLPVFLEDSIGKKIKEINCTERMDKPVRTRGEVDLENQLGWRI